MKSATSRSGSAMSNDSTGQRLPRLVLLPGLDGTGLLFEPLLRQLPAELQTQVISYPGDRRLGYDDLLNFIREKLPDEEPFVLLGESFSGPLAIRIAAQPPPGLSGLILVATFVRKPVRWLPRRLGPFIPAFAFRLFPLWSQLRVLTSGESTPELRRLYQDALTQVKPAVLAHRVSEVFQVDVAEEFQQIRIPILVIAARHDRTVPTHNLRLLQRLRSDLLVEMIETDHLVLQVKPERAAEAIRRFLGSL